MHKELFDVLEAHPDAYFQVFTNGHFITEEVAKRLRKCGNVTPLISVEGSEIISDQRRGKEGVFFGHDAGAAELLRQSSHDWRLYQSVPVQFRRSIDREMGRPTYRYGCLIHLVSYLSSRWSRIDG